MVCLRSHLVLLACALYSIAARGVDDGFISDQNQCLARNNAPLPNETITWTGGCKDGYEDGDGVQQWYTNGELGSRYEGHMAKGVPDGFGKSVHRDGQTYEGEFRNGRLHGRGIMTSAGGTRIEGQWRNGVLEGTAVIVTRGGDRYEGETRNYLPNGKGVATWANGEHYEGDWVNGNMEGQGVATSPDGSRYEGEWKRRLPSGKRTRTDAQGNRFEGTFEAGLQEGRGVATFANESRYEGEFSKGKLNNYAALMRYATEVSRIVGKYTSEGDYPRLARDRGWEGLTRVRVEIGSDGLLKTVTVTQSSGYSVLDDRAVSKIQGIKLPSIPDELRERAFTFEVPFRFSLHKREPPEWKLQDLRGTQ